MQTIGPYQLLEELGRGAMGVVFHGFDPAIGRPVAIKIIQTSQFASALADAEFELRFTREAAAAGRLSHPSIVTIFQFGEEGGVAREQRAARLGRGRFDSNANFSF